MISVIIPIYNMEQYLPRCLDSIISNTYKDLQILCIDDGSTDHSQDVLKRYSKSDSRIKIINQKNQGVSAARNNGLCHAEGEYISFIDADDWVHFQFFEALLDAILLNNSDVAYCEPYKTVKKTQQSTYVKSELQKKTLLVPA